MKQTLWNKPYSMKQNPWGYGFFHHMSSAMVQCAPTLVGSALRVVFGPQKSLLDNSRGAGGKNTAPTPHGHRFSLWFVTDATCHVDLRWLFSIWTRHGDTTTCRSGACGGARRGSAVTMTVAILTPRCRRPALLTRRDAAWPLRRAVLTRCDAAWTMRGVEATPRRRAVRQRSETCSDTTWRRLHQSGTTLLVSCACSATSYRWVRERWRDWGWRDWG